MPFYLVLKEKRQIEKRKLKIKDKRKKVYKVTSKKKVTKEKTNYKKLS